MKFQNLCSPGERRRKLRNILRACALFMLAAFVLSTLSFQARAAGVRREVLRLHVVANSNNAVDQRAKYAVRDAILAYGATLFDGSINADEAEQTLAPHLAQLQTVAQQTLQNLGLHYSVHITVGTAFFNTRSYAEAGLTFPAGRYQAVQVFLGEQTGENWWCVMFPPLCLPAATPRNATTLDAVLTDGQLRVVQADPRFEVRFRVVELWENAMERLRGDA